jgi:PAS domain S-box-containing protein
MEFFTVLVFFCLLSAFTTCALGFFVYAQDTSSRINRLFLAAMLGASYWALGEFFLWQAGSPEAVRFWLQVSACWPIVIVLTVHFVIVYTRHSSGRPEKLGLLLAALYLPAVLFSLLGIFTDTLYLVRWQAGTGFLYAPDMTRPFYPAAAVFMVLIMLWAISAGWSSWQRANGEREKKQVLLVGLGIAFTIVFGSLSGFILPIFGIQTPNLVFIGIVLFSLIITYAITRYGLFTLSPETAIPDILRTMPDGLLLIATDGRIIAANPAAARLFHQEENALSGQPAAAILPEPSYTAIMAAIREQGTFLDLEAVIDPAASRVVSIAGSEVVDPSGQSAGIVLIIRDISLRKKEERSLRVANEKISLVTRLTRHDISNLVAALAGYLLLLEDLEPAPPGDAYVRTSLDLVDRISRQLRFSGEFLAIGTFQPDWQSLGNLIARAANDLPHEGVTISTQVPQVEIFADPLSIKVVYNLLENALRHGKMLTRIAITASEKEDGTLAVIFEDDGQGIPAREKEQIFQYGVGKHTGLGLAFTRDILAVTSITIRETGTEGRGARFEILIPPSSWRRL